MSLPKIKTPTFSLKLPSTDQKVIYRPFTVKEEKILLIAQESNDSDDQVRAIKQIINNCIIEPADIDINKLASFDIEYIFLKLRAKSVGEKVEIQVLPQKREGLPPMKTTIDIDKIEPHKDPKSNNIIDIGDGLKIQMQYPTFEVLMNLNDNKSMDGLFDLFQKSMVAIYEGDTVYETKDFSQQEVQSFLEDLSSKQLLQLKTFFETLPKIRKEIEYKWINPDDSNDIYTENVVLEGLLSFLS